LKSRNLTPRNPGHPSDVADIAPVDLFARPEVTLNEVLGRLGVGFGDGGRAPALLATALEAGLAHQPGHLAFAAGDVAMEELLVDPGGTIGPIGFFVNGADQLEQRGVGDLTA
jgi:hypothetical protein